MDEPENRIPTPVQRRVQRKEPWRDNFNAMAADFEKNHAQIIESGKYVEETKEGPRFLTMAQMVISYRHLTCGFVKNKPISFIKSGWMQIQICVAMKMWKSSPIHLYGHPISLIVGPHLQWPSFNSMTQNR